ncbi:MAG: glutathione S-transferase family protein [Rhizobiaceae bacterium]|nr:MAG: glutathione S-transferase family protein [Rhizobiaceae bacterium]
MLTLYGMADSGNCYKPRLLLARLNRPFRHVEVNALDGSTRRPDFLARNPNGQVPLLELDDGRTLRESNAILLYLAEGTPFLPADAFQRALVCQWLFFEQYSHEPYIAVRRALIRYPERAAEATPERLSSTLDRGHRALAVMESQLTTTRFIAGEDYTIADIALYPYTCDARSAGFEMERFPAIAAWLDRIASTPGHVAITWLPR